MGLEQPAGRTISAAVRRDQGIGQQGTATSSNAKAIGNAGACKQPPRRTRSQEVLPTSAMISRRRAPFPDQEAQARAHQGQSQDAPEA